MGWVGNFQQQGQRAMSAALAPPAPSQPAYRRAFPLQGVDPSQVPRDGGRPNSREWLGPRLGGQHAGWDIPGAVGSPVSAVSDGRILRVGQGQGYGNMVDVAYADGTVHRMGHLQGFADGLHEGQTVQAGQPLGRLGYTGNAGPEFPHLHYEVFPNTDAYRKSDGISSREGAGLRIDPRHFNIRVKRQRHAHPPLHKTFGFAEQTDVRVRYA